jgi:hypothetical protein
LGSRIVAAATAGLLAAHSVGITGASPAAAKAPGALTRADYEACQAKDDATFRKAIEAITLDKLAGATKSFDYAGSVADAWRGQGMDDILDRRVDAVIAEVGQETSWGALLQSLMDSKKAQELATAVAERVYRSDAIKAGLEKVVEKVSDTLSLSLEFAGKEAADPTVACLQAFIGPRFGSTVSSAAGADASRNVAIDNTGTATVSSGAVIAQSSGGITGAAILLMRRQLANIAGRVGQRLVGSVMSRLVGVVAGGVGAVLIVKDIWELRAGVLPIIATEMKGKATKDLVRAEMAKSIAEQIGEQVKDVAAKSADRMIEIWQTFRSAHAKALELAEREPRFRDFLDTTTPRNLASLDEVISVLLGTEGEPAIMARLANGTLDAAVNKLPDAGMAILRETRSVETALAWSAVAGDQLAKVADNGLHQRMKPGEVTRAMLLKLFALDDKLAISRLSALPREARATLFDLDSASLKLLARALPEAELSALSGYLTGLEAGPRERVLKTIAAAPRKMKLLAAGRVREAIVASRDQALAVDMMLRDGSGTAAEIIGDLRSALDGKLSPWLIWERHPMLVGFGIVPLLVVLMLVWRIFARPRRRARTAT